VVDIVSMVLRYCLPADALYMPGHVVEPGCEGSLALFLIFLSNVPYA
jgi:hypothetical protein